MGGFDVGQKYSMLARSLFILVLALSQEIYAYEDNLAVPIRLHTTVELPGPRRSGEIIAEVKHDQKEASTSFSSMKIKLGDQLIEVPDHILAFFPSPRLSTLELWVAPTESTSAQPDYFNLTFRFGSYSYNGIFSPDEGLGGSIMIRNGKIEKIGKTDVLVSGRAAVYTDFDPKTLREIDHNLKNK